MSETDKEPLTMKKLETRIDELEKKIDERRSASVELSLLLVEMEHLVDIGKEVTRKMRMVSRAYIIKTVVEVLFFTVMFVCAISCECELPGGLVKPDEIVKPEITEPDVENPEVKPDNGSGDDVVVPEKNSINGTVWACEPVVIDNMNVVRIEFSEDGLSGYVFFEVRGNERSRNFDVVGSDLVFATPESIWSFTTDYVTKLTVNWDDMVTAEFTPYENVIV